MNISLEQLQYNLTQGAKIFIIGMVLQFFGHTIVTYGIGLPSFLSFIWLWKEVLIIIMGGLALRGIWKFPQIKGNFIKNQYHWIIVITIILAGLVALFNSTLIHNQSIITFFVSAKYNFMPLTIAGIGILVAHIITKEQYESILSTFITTIKYVLLFSILRYCILHTIPNILDRIGFAQPGMSIEREAGSPPPSLYLTEFYSGHVRNQGPFSGPLSLGFYLVGLWPLFFSKVLYKKKLSDTRLRWALYIGILWSTFSRAAWGVFIISSIALAIILYKKHSKYIIAGGLIIFLGSLLYIFTGGESQFLVRTRSDQGHIEFFKQGLNLVKENRLWGLGAASVGPGSHHSSDVIEVFNPENQYMQIWLEYGLIGLISWLMTYIVLIRNSFRKYLQILFSKTSELLSSQTLLFIGISISIISLSIAGFVLHPFTESGSMYPIMLWIGLSIGQLSSHYIHIKSTGPLFSYGILSGIKIWLIIISLLFTIQTIGTGLGIIENPIIISSLRDSIRIGTIIFLVIQYHKLILGFIKSTYRIIIPIILLLGINIMTLIQGYHNGEFLHIIAGVKYDIHYLIILGGALRIGYILAHNHTSTTIEKFISWFINFASVLLIISILRQLSKNIRPDFFINHLGFSSPNDFIPFQQPPIYYLTGPGGLQRFSGLFIGPNTLGFFLISLFPLFYFRYKKLLSSIHKWIIGIIYIMMIILTFSRGAILGHTIALLGIIFIYPYLVSNITIKESIYKHIKILRRHIIILCITSGIVLIGINQRKDTSNEERFNSLNTISITKLVSWGGKGAGYVGPAKHYESSYLIDQKNQFSMVENIYVQTLINQGILGFLLTISIFISLIYYHIHIKRHLSTLVKKSIIYHYAQLLGLGLGSLIIIGRYLHIFIDSMTNYLFFSIYGIILGYSIYSLSTQRTS